MKTHMETLLDTMRDIAQVNTDPVAPGHFEMNTIVHDSRPVTLVFT